MTPQTAGAVAMAPDASWVVVVAGDGAVRTWGSLTVGTPDAIHRVTGIDVGQPVAVARAGERVRVLWAVQGSIRRHEIVGGIWPKDDAFPAPAQVRALAFAPSGDVAVVACADGTLRGLNAGTGQFGWTLDTGAVTARAVAMASDRGPVIAAFDDGSVRRYDLATGQSAIVGIGRSVQLVVVTPDGGAVIAACADGVLLRWRPSLSALPDFRALGIAVTALATDGTGNRVLVGATDGRLWLHDFIGGPAIEFGAAEADVSTRPVRGWPEQQPGLGTVVDEDVRFTVYRPQAISSGVWASLMVFAHKTDLVIQPGQPPVDPVRQVEEIADRHFHDVRVRRDSQDARSAVFRGARLRVVADLPDLVCNPGEYEFDWREPVHHVIFRLLAGPELVGTVVRGAVRIWCGPLLLGELFLAISVTADAPGAGAPTMTESALRYRKIFPSYSHDDRAIVDAFADVVRAFGDQYLQDVLALRSGERWRARLAELIEEADIFQLFWSSRSMRSRYCQEEWEHALALRRPMFVRPVYWEDPMPQDAALGLPPVALRELHFVKVRPHLPPGGGYEVSGTYTGLDSPAAAGAVFEPTSPAPQQLDAQGEAHDALGTAVSSYGPRVLSNPHILGNLVTDLLPDLPRERSLLVAGAEAGIAADMAQHVEEQHIDPDTAVQLVARTLSERRAIGPAASMWLASEYAQALGYRVRPFSQPVQADQGPGAPTMTERGQPMQTQPPAGQRFPQGPPAQSWPPPPPGQSGPPVQGPPFRSPSTGGNRKRGLIIGLAAVGVVLLCLIIAVVAGVGPFGH